MMIVLFISTIVLCVLAKLATERHWARVIHKVENDSEAVREAKKELNGILAGERRAEAREHALNSQRLSLLANRRSLQRRLEELQKEDDPIGKKTPQTQ